MKGKKKGLKQLGQNPFDEPYPTPEQLRIRGLARAVDALMGVPDERDSARYAYPLIEELKKCADCILTKY